MADTPYLALYRKYRPQTFEDVRGRDTIVRTLKNQIIHDRISHSYLFCGTRGTGKTTIAKIFAKAVNCEHPVDGSPCGECSVCRAIAQDANLNVVEMDAASNNGVDDIRGVIEQVAYSPTLGKKRVYIIDEVHMLSASASNALLKTLEEPPEYAIFILATTEPNRLPITILSRCQRYDFGRLPTATIAGRLREVSDAENLRVEDKALNYIASAADGSMRDGLSLLDQCNAFNYGEEILTYEKTLDILGAVDMSVFSDLYRKIIGQDPAGALDILDRILLQGRELMQFIADFISFLRNLMMLMVSAKASSGIDVSDENMSRLKADAASGDISAVLRLVRLFSELTERVRFSANRRILTEAAIIRACLPATDMDADAMEERMRVLEEQFVRGERIIAGLERRIAQGTVVSAAPGAAQAAPGTGFTAPAGTAAPEPKTEIKKIKPDALPDDLRSVVAAWPKLLTGLAGYLKAELSRAKLSLGGNNQLIILFSNYIAADSFNQDEEKRKELEDYLAERTGMRIPLEYRSLDNEGQQVDNILDLSDKVAMDIEVDDDTSDDED